MTTKDELLDQIEDMKNCANCGYGVIFDHACSNDIICSCSGSTVEPWNACNSWEYEPDKS